jgi:hypothetical protein
LQNERLPSLSFRPQGEISGGKVQDFSLSLEMSGNNFSSIFVHQQSRYVASGSTVTMEFNQLKKDKIMLKVRFFLNEPNGKP